MHRAVPFLAIVGTVVALTAAPAMADVLTPVNPHQHFIIAPGLASPPAAPASTQTIDFEAIPANTVAGSQYAAQGIRFGRRPPDVAGDSLRAQNSATARSGQRVLDAPCSAEVCFADELDALLSAPSRRIVVHIRGGGNVRVSGLDAAGTVQDVATVAADASWKPAVLEVSEPDPPMFGFTVEAQQGITTHQIDDVQFEVPDGPLMPDFALVAPELSYGNTLFGKIRLVRGQSTTVPLKVVRFGGAQGPLKFSALSLPSGVTATFEPAATTAAADLELVLKASEVGATPSTTITVRADPQGNAQAGSAVRELKLPLQLVEQWDIQITGIEVTQGIQPNFNGVAPGPVFAAGPGFPGGDPFEYPDQDPLVQGGTTIARVYANNATFETVIGVPAVLHAFVDTPSGAVELPGSPISASPRNLSFGIFLTLDDDRLDSASSYDFILPSGWTQGKFSSKTIRLRAELLPPTGSLFFDAGECLAKACADNNNLTAKGVTFYKQPTFEVGPLRLHVDGKPDPSAPRFVFEDAKNLTPVSDSKFKVRDYITTVDITDVFNSAQAFPDALADYFGGRNDFVNAVAKARVEELADDYDDEDAYDSIETFVGVVSDEAIARGVMGGDLNGDFTDDPVGVVAENRPMTSVAHELHHSLGRDHASTCTDGNDPGDTEDWPPDQQGLVQGFGIERRSTVLDGLKVHPNNLGTISPTAFDFMSYCADVDRDICYFATLLDAGKAFEGECDGLTKEERISPVVWTSRLGWLRSFNELRDYGDFDPVFGISTAGHDHSSHDHGKAADSSGGELARTLRAAGLDPEARGGFPRRVASLVPTGTRRGARKAARLSQSPGGSDVRVYGTVFASGATLVHGATPTDAAADPTGPAGAISLVTRRADGSAISSVPAKLDAIHVHSGSKLVAFTGQLPATGAAGVEVYNGQDKIGEFLRSPTVPSVTVTAPRRGSLAGRKRRTRIAWRTTDPDGGSLLAKIECSFNGGRNFRTLAAKPTKPGADTIVLPSARLAASRNARIRVKVSDGFNQGTGMSSRFRARGARPQVVITSPARRALFPADGLIPLSGYATDDRGERIPGRRLTWFFGNRRLGGGGEQSTLFQPTPGRGRITLHARDRRGRVSRRTVLIRVRAVRPQFLTLDVPARLAPRKRKLRLRIASTIPASARVGKRRFRVGRRVRRIAVDVPRGKAPLRRRVILAAGGKRTRVVIVVPRV